MTISTLITANDLSDMGAEARFELIEGALVEYPLHGGLHGATVGRLSARIGAYLRISPVGELYTGQVGCVIERNPDTVLEPDLAFIRHERLHDDADDGFLLVPPDLVAEVLEPWDPADFVERKVDIYLRSGVGQIWVVDPSGRSVRVHEVNRDAIELGEPDSIDGGTSLPGFALPLSDLFES